MTWPQDAYVGQKVVCIKPFPTAIRPFLKVPKVGEVVTVSWIGIVVVHILIDLVEYPQPDEYEWVRGCYAYAFRPVQSTSTGFTILAKLQNPINRRQLEGVE